MNITPLDIQQKVFPTQFKGFDREAVLTFLEVVREQMEDLVRELGALKEKDAQRERELKEYKDTEAAMRSMLTQTQQMVEEYRTDAEREAQIIKKEAEFQARTMLDEARRKVMKMEAGIADLRGIQRHFKSEIRRLIGSHLSMLDSYEGIESTPVPSPNGDDPGDDIEEKKCPLSMIELSHLHTILNNGSKPEQSETQTG